LEISILQAHPAALRRSVCTFTNGSFSIEPMVAASVGNGVGSGRETRYFRRKSELVGVLLYAGDAQEQNKGLIRCAAAPCCTVLHLQIAAANDRESVRRVL